MGIVNLLGIPNKSNKKISNVNIFLDLLKLNNFKWYIIYKL